MLQNTTAHDAMQSQQSQHTGWLTIEQGRIERTMPQHCCLPDQIARILVKVLAGKGMPQRRSGEKNSKSRNGSPRLDFLGGK